MDGELIARVFPFSSTDSDYHNPISTHWDYEIPEVLNYHEPVAPCTNMSRTPEKDPSKQIVLCDVILKYINSVLMEDDDLEDMAATIKDSKLDATKRSFHEIILGNNLSGEDGDDMAGTRNLKFLMKDDESFIHEMFSKMGLRHGRNDEAILLKHYTGLPKKTICKREGIDMRNLLLQCMQSVAISDHTNAKILLDEIRTRASAHGDGVQRLAHYFAEGLEIRLTGNGVPEHKSLPVKIYSDNDILKAFKIFLTKFPFTETAYFFANQTIMELANKADNLHIVNFGIMHGLQWPPLIQHLSKRPGGPPKLRITSIDFPITGFRPDARVKETGHRLASYCAEYNVPFEYDCLARVWETVEREDIRIEKGETLVINCMYHFMYVHDDTVAERSPRDKVLNLMRRIKPDLFIHVIVNGTYNSPFFVSRFREAMFQYSTWFDMFEANFPRDSPERMVFEKEIWRREILNIVASEGLQRAERPETYRQWQKRTMRAGFKPVALNPDIVNEIQTHVKKCYHKDFFVDKAGHWLIDGWKGRALFGASCWKPI